MGLSRRLAFAPLLALMMWLPAAARAEAPGVAILPVAVEEGSKAGVDKEIIAVLAGELSRQGFVVQRPSELRARLKPSQRACVPTDCGAAVQSLLGVEYLAAASFFHMTASESLSVTIVADGGLAYEGHALVNAEQPIAAAALAALQAALTAQRRGPGPWLLVRGLPEGADVLVNGKPSGELPRALVRVAPGLTEVVVREPGYVEHEAMHTVNADIDELVEIEIALRRLDGAAHASVRTPGEVAQAGEPTTDPVFSSPAVRSESSPWNAIIGWSLVGVGAIYGIAAVVGGLRDGDCAGSRDVMGRCGERVELGSRFGVQVGIAAASVAAGGLVLVTQPFE